MGKDESTSTGLKLLKEYVEAAGFALVAALIIRSSILGAYKIPSGSMLETLQIGDHLFVNKLSYDVKIPFWGKSIFAVGDPERGDVIVFKYPKDESIDYIKRIVGVPGDEIAVIDKQLYRNGEPVKEDYIKFTSSMFESPRDAMPPVRVPKDKFFVMGDNRDNSQDSRYWGFVDRDAIRGKAFIIYWSWEGSFPKVEIRWNRLLKLVR